MKELRFDSHPLALAQMVADINSREFSPDEYHIALCPDRYTQSVEQALFCDPESGSGGALDCEVLTLSRLAYRVAPNADVLSQEGGVMITARAIAAVASELEYYGRAVVFGDFAREVYKTLQQISSSDVAIADVRAEGGAKSKLHDLLLIKTEYDKIKGGYSDSADRLCALASAAAHSPLISSAHFYAVGYSDTTKLNRRVFNAIAAHARSFTVYDAYKTDKKRKSMFVFGGQDCVDEYKQIAAEIREHVYNGGKYSDAAVICSSPRALKRILDEYEIPFYSDETKPLSETSPLDAVAGVYKLYTDVKRRSAVECETLVALCKNPFAGCAPLDAEKLQFESASRGLGFVPTDIEFDDFGARRAAARALGTLGIFDDKSSFGAAVRAVAEYCDFAGVRQSLGDNGTDDVTPMIALSELSDRYGSGDFDTDAKAFFSAAQAVNVNTLPRERDCVTVTSPATLRLSAVKRLFVADFNEGVLPVVTSDTGLISDAELVAMNGVIEPTVQQLNRRARDELGAVVRNAQSVYVAYSAADGRPAAFINELAVETVRTDYIEQRAVLAHTRDKQLIAKHASTAGAARELAARRLTEYGDSLRIAASGGAAVLAEFENRIDGMQKPTLSVSELSHWFKCPYYRFLSDAVGVNERRGGFGALDFGIVVHDFMRRFVADGVFDCSEPVIRSMIDDVLAERDIKPSPSEYARIVADAADYAAVNAEILRAGDYRAAQTEYGFGGIPLGSSGTELVGYIDRFDLCGDRARIIDYKTNSAKKFDIEQCYNGCDMQLPLYAYALPYEVTGMFYVRLCKKYNSDKPERAMSGCMVADTDVAVQYDRGLTAGGATSNIIPVRLKTDKSGAVVFSGRLSSALMDRDSFAALLQKCKNNADVAADEIAAGYIMRSPVAGACERCAYLGICGGGTPRGSSEDDGEEA